MRQLSYRAKQKLVYSIVLMAAVVALGFACSGCGKPETRTETVVVEDHTLAAEVGALTRELAQMQADLVALQNQNDVEQALLEEEISALSNQIQDLKTIINNIKSNRGHKGPKKSKED